ncbi:MAG: protein-glutamate O-methyltransferase CheR [Gammaproteobacteria bacterium]
MVTTQPDNKNASKTREFAFSDEDFNALRALVKEHTGINLTDQKRELVYGRISRRLRALDLDSFRDYRELLSDESGKEFVEFCNAITTNLTSFFRESHHFDYVREHILAPRLNDPRGARRIRIWCAGCSSGEEPYSLAMTIRETITDAGRWDIRILATDLDSEVLARGERGVYTAERVRDMSSARVNRFFRETTLNGQPAYTVAPELRDLITFKQLNLMTPFPMKGPLDAIFCRNVVIYFDKDTQRDLFGRMARLQEPGAILFLGHSESLFKVSTDYSLIGKTIYRRV